MPTPGAETFAFGPSRFLASRLGELAVPASPLHDDFILDVHASALIDHRFLVLKTAILEDSSSPSDKSPFDIAHFGDLEPEQAESLVGQLTRFAQSLEGLDSTGREQVRDDIKQHRRKTVSRIGAIEQQLASRRLCRGLGGSATNGVIG